MRIALDISPIHTGHKLRGIGSYTGQLIEALKKYENKHSYYFFTRGQRIPKDVDLVHYPYFDPFFLTLPLIKPYPTVVTVHDLIPIAFAEHFPRGVRGELKWQVQKLSLRGVNKVITDSQASAVDIASFTAVTPDRIKVVYLAPAPTLGRISDKAALNKVKTRFSLPDKFVLYVGDVNWNKNVAGLIKAFAKVHQELGEIKLVLVGKQFLNLSLPETGEINQLIDDLQLKPHVIKPGFVEDKELAVIYSLASVYVQPSFAEGFGFPVLEAMACGCPVVAAKAASLIEIAGPAQLVDPDDPQDIAGGVSFLSTLTKAERERIVREGFLWVKRFSWQKVARETARVYESLVA